MIRRITIIQDTINSPDRFEITVTEKLPDKLSVNRRLVMTEEFVDDMKLFEFNRLLNLVMT